MTFNEYQKLAARTMNPALSKEETGRHAVFGLAAEAGEFCGLFQKQYQGHEITWDDIIKELGDVLWMVAEYCTVYGIDLDDIAAENIRKLEKRYPEGFDSGRSIHREEE